MTKLNMIITPPLQQKIDFLKKYYRFRYTSEVVRFLLDKYSKKENEK